jgi:anti-sigma factor RsiW
MASDRDLELIEAYLDDALSAEEVERLDRRLTDDPELAAALHEQRTSRALRIAAYQDADPDEADVEQLSQRIIGELHRRQRAMIVRRWTRIAGAVAACILFGFVAGWLGRSRAESEGAFRQSRGGTHGIAVDPVGVYQVFLTDDNGNTIKEQTFSEYEQARRFADDLAGYEGQHISPPKPKQGSATSSNSPK